jgi:hypothetical protein
MVTIEAVSTTSEVGGWPSRTAETMINGNRM